MPFQDLHFTVDSTAPTTWERVGTPALQITFLGDAIQGLITLSVGGSASGGDGALVVTNGSNFSGRIESALVTADRDYQLPDDDGTLLVSGAPATLGRIVATSTTEEHQLIGDYPFSSYTTTAVLRLRHNDNVFGTSGIIFNGPNTANEYSAIGCGAPGIYAANFWESSDEQGQSSGLPLRIIQRSTLSGTKSYSSAIRFDLSIASGGPMTFKNSTGAADMLTIQDGAIKVGALNSNNCQLRLSPDSGYTTGGVAFYDGNGVVGGQIFAAQNNEFYIKGGSNHGIGFVNSAGSTVVAYIRDDGKLIATGFQTAIAAKTTTYTIVNADQVINCTSGTFTVTLLTAVGRAGQQFVVKNSGVGVITLATTSAQTIDGLTTQTIVAGNSITVVSDGANWLII